MNVRDTLVVLAELHQTSERAAVYKSDDASLGLPTGSVLILEMNGHHYGSYCGRDVL